MAPSSDTCTLTALLRRAGLEHLLPRFVEDPQVTEAAMAEATRDRRLGACRLQKRSGGGIQARTTATGQFSCADMKLHIVAFCAIYAASTMAQTGVSGLVVVDGESFLDALFASAGQG